MAIDTMISPLECHQSGKTSTKTNSMAMNAMISPLECYQSGKTGAEKPDYQYTHYTQRANKANEHPLEHHQSGKNKDLDGVPVEYHDFVDIFNTEKARSMPEDRGIWNFK